MGSPYCLVYCTYYLSTAPLLSHVQISQCTATELKSCDWHFHAARRPLRTKIIAAGEAMGGLYPGQKQGRSMKGLTFKTDSHFITLDFENIRPTRGPSPMELALGISAASRCCFVYYPLLKSVEHNDKRHSVPGRISKEL